MNPDMEAPTILVEPPHDEEQEDLIDGGYNNSLNSFTGDHPDLQALFRQVYPVATSSSSNQPIAEFGLFSAPFEQSPLNPGQMSPLITTGLRDGSAGNIFLSPTSPNDQNTPSDPAWSPASTSSGDGKVFSDNWSDCSSNWSPSVQSSSPSSPSLSPLNTSFHNIALVDSLTDNASGPALLRQRSNSYTGSSDPQADLGLRPRSASFTNLASSSVDNNNFFQSSEQAGEYSLPQNSPQIPEWSVEQSNAFLSSNASINNAYGFVPENPHDWSHVDMSSLQMQSTSTMVYQPPPGPPPAHATHGRSLSTHLTVPAALHRRDAHRRSHSHTGVHEVEPRSQGTNSIRGRQRFSPSRASISRPASREPSPQPPHSPQFANHLPSYLNLAPATTPPIDTSFFSVTPQSSSRSQSPSSPSIAITVPEQQVDLLPVINVDDYDNSGIERRHTVAGNRSRSSSRESGPSSEGTSSLHRAISDPSGQRPQRKPRGPTITRRYSGMLRPAEEVDDGPYHSGTMMINVPIEGVTSSTPSEFKAIVGSDKIVKASNSRRKNEPKFVCEICGHKFTAKHNLNNHMNSHSNKRPHECIKCGHSFVTKGTHARHEAKCSGKPVRKRY